MKRYLPWLVVILITTVGVIQLITSILFQPEIKSEDNFVLGLIAVISVSLLLPVTFASMGALIVTHQFGNRVGWYLLLAGFSWAIPSDIDTILYPVAPDSVTLGLWLLLWFYNWSWLLRFLTIPLILLNFPDGRPLSSRWRWLNKLAVILLLFWAVSSMFWEQIGPTGDTWTVSNPIGFLTEIGIIVFAVLFYIGMLILIVGSIASLFTRYRRAKAIERQQIKWLLFSGGFSILAIVMIAIVYLGQVPEAGWLLIFLLLSVTAIPITIAIAILRFRLYDIDIIIRRTLQYTLLTGLLVLVYFGSVVLLQSLVENVTGEQSPVVIVISTLAIAAIFNPLRIRTQDFIDRRFFRKKYDAEQTLARFAEVARDEVDMEKLTVTLLGVVEESMQPENVSVWLQGPEVRT